MPSSSQTFNRVFALSVAMGVCVGATVQAQQSLPVSPVPALQVGINGVTGKTYRLFESTDLANWSPLGVRRFGVGTELLSIEPAPEPGKFFRYVVDTEPQGGLAPWTVMGVIWDINIGGNTHTYAFNSAATGTVLPAGRSVAQPMTYTFLRTGENTLQLTLILPGDLVRKLECTYYTSSLGTVSLKDFVDGSVIDTAGGMFQPQAEAPAPLTAMAVPSAPPALSGRCLLLQDASGTVLANFSVRPLNRQLGSSEGAAAASDYRTTGSATATFTIRGTAIDSYQLKFKSARSGTFFRKRTVTGLPTLSQTGQFILASTP